MSVLWPQKKVLREPDFGRNRYFLQFLWNSCPHSVFVAKVFCPDSGTEEVREVIIGINCNSVPFGILAGVQGVLLFTGVIGIDHEREFVRGLKRRDPVKEKSVMRIIVCLLGAIHKVEGHRKRFDRRYRKPRPNGLAFVIVVRNIPSVDQIEVGREGLRKGVFSHKARVSKRYRKVEEESSGVVEIIPRLDHFRAMIGNKFSKLYLQAAAKGCDIIYIGFGQVKLVIRFAKTGRVDELRRFTC